MRGPNPSITIISDSFAAGWSSPVARQAHNLKVTGSNPVPAPKFETAPAHAGAVFVCAQNRQTVPMIGEIMGERGMTTQVYIGLLLAGLLAAATSATAQSTS